jgi:hypothetical protein
MKRSPCRVAAIPLAGLALLTSLQAFGQQAPGTPPGTLAGCAAIEGPSERLSCYDHLAGRPVAPPSATPSPIAHNSAGALAPPNNSSSPGAPLPPSAPSPAAVAPPAPSPQSFGLYTAEHPLPPVAPTLSAKVIALGTSYAGNATVTIEGGQLWELLDGADPVLTEGQTVTIRRAALGSFLLTTAAKRTHRVHRLR